jgi:hypothetical protein
VVQIIQRRSELAIASCGLANSFGLTLSEDGFGFFRGVALATFSGGDAFGESLADVVVVLKEPVAFGLGFEEVEGVVEEVVGSGVGAAGRLALDALFGGGREGERHGRSLSLMGAAGGCRLYGPPTHAPNARA